MDTKRYSVPEERGYDKAYALSYKLAAEKLGNLDIEQQCQQSGTECPTATRKSIVVRYLDQPYEINLPAVEISLAGSSEDIPIRDKLLILHYFVTAKGTPLANRLITFRELPDGTVYFPTFAKRTIKPIEDNFGKTPERLLEVAGRLGGRRTEYGDTAVTIDAFSHVPVTIVLWRGDEEFPPQGNMLFDATIYDYLPTEDITVLGETIAWKLVRYLKEK